MTDLRVGKGRPRKRHGHILDKRRGSREYNTWRGMIARCTNPKHDAYPRYGGAGVTVCERWRASFEAFLADMGPRPDGLTLERIDNRGNYEPGNCRWATAREQAQNRKSCRKVEHAGELLTISEWARRTGLTKQIIKERLNRGWSPERSLTTPPVARGLRARPAGQEATSLPRWH